jgi:hypothetical protein
MAGMHGRETLFPSLNFVMIDIMVGLGEPQCENESEEEVASIIPSDLEQCGQAEH